MLTIVICLLMEKKSFSLKTTLKKFDFPTQFCLGSISNAFSAIAPREALFITLANLK